MGTPSEQKSENDQGLTASKNILPTLENVCIVFDLKKGTIIVGVINMVSIQ